MFHVTKTTTFHWLADDIKGNVSTGQRKFTIAADQLTLTAASGPPRRAARSIDAS